MKQKKNIAIICLDRTMSRSTAQLVASELGIRFFDMRELFEFDHKPKTFKEMISEYGIKYYRQKENDLISYASTFENVLFNIDSDASCRKDGLKKLKNNYLIIYLHLSATLAYNIAQKEDYSCYKEKTMYAVDKEQITKRIKNLRDQADIEVNVSSSSSFKASADIIRAIRKYYGV